MPKFLVISKQMETPSSPEMLKRLLPAQFQYVKDLSQKGKIECGYGFAGTKGGFAVIDASTNGELQKIVSGYPMFPLITVEIYPLITVDETAAAAQEMLSRMP